MMMMMIWIMNEGLFQEAPLSSRSSKGTVSEKDLEVANPFLRSDFNIDKENEDTSMEYFVLNTIHLVLKANLQFDLFLFSKTIFWSWFRVGNDNDDDNHDVIMMIMKRWNILIMTMI